MHMLYNVTQFTFYVTDEPMQPKKFLAWQSELFQYRIAADF